MSDAPETTCPYCDEDALAMAHFQGVRGERARMQPRIDALEAERDRMRYVLDGVAGAIDTGRNEPLVIWREQIEIARAALSKKDT